MVTRARDQIVHEVAGYVDEAIRKNRRSEWLIAGLLVAQFVAGLALLTAGAALDRWALIVPGGLLSSLLFWPVQKLIRLRANNLRLQLLPELLRLAETKQAQQLAAKLIDRLIETMEL